MSIYGPSDNEAGESSRDELYAYVDNVARGVARQVESRAFLLHGTSRPVRDISLNDNKIIELGGPADNTDAANKNYVDQRVRAVPHFITVWAETKGPLSDGKFEWSFGSGVRYNREGGYTLLAPGAVHKIGLSGGSLSSDSTVKITVNGVVRDNFFVTKPMGDRSVVKTFNRPLFLGEGDVLTLVSVVPKGVTSDALRTVVSMLIQLNV